MFFAMQKTDFHVLELFCRVSHLRASLLRITSLELLRTLNLCLVQLSKLTERKAEYAILIVNLKYVKYVSFS